MAPDQPDDDLGPGDAQSEQHFRLDRSSGDAPAARAEPVEPRTREEYCEALRAADGGPADGRHEAADSQTDHSGWDSVDATDRPPAQDIRATPERTTHILDGDADGGAAIGTAPAIPARPSSRPHGTTKKSSTHWWMSHVGLISRPSIKSGTTVGWHVERETM